MSAALGLGVSVTVHADASTVIVSKLLTVDGQPPCPTLRVEGARSNVVVFAERPELIRLRAAIDDVLADLDSAQAQESAA